VIVAFVPTFLVNRPTVTYSLSGCSSSLSFNECTALAIATAASRHVVSSEMATLGTSDPRIFIAAGCLETASDRVSSCLPAKRPCRCRVDLVARAGGRLRDDVHDAPVLVVD